MELSDFNLDNTKILVVWNAPFDRYPAPVLSSNQYTVYRPGEGTNLPEKSTVFQDETYSLADLGKTFCPIESFKLVMVLTGAKEQNKPTEIQKFNCPKILILLDTHHMEYKPITRVRAYANDQGFDAVISLYNRDHLKWFSDNQQMKRGWFPGLTVEHIPKPFTADREHQIVFVGNWFKVHHARKRILEEIDQSELPLKVIKVSRKESASYFSSSIIAFNCSLNGDLNMRNFEILSAGGFLMTDKLPSQSGLDLCLRAGFEYVSYEGFDDFKFKAQYYLAHPEEALAIAQNGHAAYLKNFQSAKVAGEIVSWCKDLTSSENAIDTELGVIDKVSLEQRLDIYECCQIIQLHHEQVKVLAMGPRSMQVIHDLLGLCRKQLYYLKSEHYSDMNHKIVGLEDLENSTWNVVLADQECESEFEAANIKYKKLFVL